MSDVVLFVVQAARALTRLVLALQTNQLCTLQRGPATWKRGPPGAGMERPYVYDVHREAAYSGTRKSDWRSRGAACGKDCVSMRASTVRNFYSRSDTGVQGVRGVRGVARPL